MCEAILEFMQCIMVGKPGGEVRCVISEGPWVFIGIPNAVKVRVLRFLYKLLF